MSWIGDAIKFVQSHVEPAAAEHSGVTHPVAATSTLSPKEEHKKELEKEQIKVAQIQQREMEQKAEKQAQEEVKKNMEEIFKTHELKLSAITTQLAQIPLLEKPIDVADSVLHGAPMTVPTLNYAKGPVGPGR